jgi:hypothetical protein
METTTTDLYEALQELPNSKAAKKIADYMEESRQLNLERMREIFMTKDDKAEFIAMTKADNADLMKEIFATKEDVLNFRNELSKQISSVYVKLIFWVVGTGILQVILKKLGYL